MGRDAQPINCRECGYTFSHERDHPAGEHGDTRRCPSCGHLHEFLPDTRPYFSDRDTASKDDAEAAVLEDVDELSAEQVVSLLTGDADGLTAEQVAALLAAADDEADE